ncbi:MAG: endolytic transglycosylase MltG [Actinobacteria bacterium]|nr:endolytic transglycosylase MltG [Actinomycetota bacterium]NCU83409.1 endolytic transglycosylase MltG [Actinomycetota bacterium]
MRFNGRSLTLSLEKSPILRLVTAGIFIALITFSLRELNSAAQSAPDYDAGSAGPEVIVEILTGESGSEIGRKLESLSVVKSSAAFFKVAVTDARARRIAPGEHRIETRIPAKTALEQLLDPARIPNLIVVRDGQRLTEISESIASFGISKIDLERSIKTASPPEMFKTKSIEGFLYPAQYSFNKNAKANEIISAMINRFSFATKDLNWNNERDFTPFEVMVIASLVQTEGTPDVFAKVSRVIYNRLEKRMPLQFDSTVHYALNRRGEIRVSIVDTKVRNRYNTFIYPGLPPGPIGSPTRAAIDAAIDPEVGNWLYFVTVKPFDTRFTDSYDQFLKWKSEYRKNFRDGLFE